MKEKPDKYDTDQTILRLRYGKQKPNQIKFAHMPLHKIATIVKKSYSYCQRIAK